MIRSQKENKRNQVIRFTLILSLTVLAILPACKNKEESQNREELPPENEVHFSPEKIKHAGIDTGKVEYRVLSDFTECTGIIDVPPQNRAIIQSPLKGFVKKHQWLEGDYISKGQEILRLSHPVFFEIQQAFLDAKTQVDYWEKEFQRQKILYKEKANAPKIYQDTEKSYKLVVSDYNARKQYLEYLGFNTGNILQGNFEKDLVIKAPINGYISREMPAIGNLLNPEDQITEIIDLSHFHLVLNVYGKDLNKIRKGQKIEFSLPKNQNKLFYGESFLVTPNINTETRTLKVHAHILDNNSAFVPGMHINAKILFSNEERPSLPAEAFIHEGDEYFVFIVENESFIKTKVDKGISLGDYAELKAFEGDFENTIFVTKGAYYINAEMTK